MALTDYLIEGVTPNRRIKDSDHFGERYISDALKDPAVRKLLFDENGNRREGSETLEQKLKEELKKSFKGKGEAYFSRGVNLPRYAALGLGVLGSVTAIGGIIGIAAGAPAAGAIAAIGAGLVELLGSAGAGTAADIKDAVDTNKALEGKLAVEKPKGFLGYVKKAATGTWEYVKGAFDPKTYKENYKQLLEGLAYRVAPLLGIQYGAPEGVVGIIADYIRGGKKFDNKVISYVIKDGIQNWLKEIEGGKVIKIPELPDKDVIDIGKLLEEVEKQKEKYRHHRVVALEPKPTDPHYQLMEYQKMLERGDNPRHTYVEPRLAAVGGK